MAIKKTKRAASDGIEILTAKERPSGKVEILTADDLLREDGEYARVEIVYDKVKVGTWIK